MIKVLICDGNGTLELPNPSKEVFDLIEALPALDIELAVASNDIKRRIEHRFINAGLTIPPIIVTQKDVGVRKPSPKHVYRIQQLTGVELNQIAYLGDDDKTDAFCAINAKVLPISALYSSSGKPMEYGLPAHSPKALLRYLETFGLQDTFYGWSFDQVCKDSKKTISVNVLFGDHGSLGITSDLKSILKNQRHIQIGSYKVELGALLFHYLLSQLYLGGLIQEIDWITVYPGHRAGISNPLLDEFSGLIAPVFKDKFILDLLIRHKDAPESKSFFGERNIFNQFKTISVNPTYGNNLQGKTILVLDDFTTSGCSLETARRMLLQAGASQVVCVAFAKYRATHVVTSISKSWDPYQPCTLLEGDICTITQKGTFNIESDNYFKESILPVYSK